LNTIPLYTPLNNSRPPPTTTSPVNSLPTLNPLLTESELPEEMPNSQIVSPTLPVSADTEVTETSIINNPNLTTPKNESTKKLDTDSEEGNIEETVQAILGKRLNKRRHREEWKTKWGDGSITWEPKENFVDYEDGVEIVNSHWLEFEEKEAEKKKNLKLNLPGNNRQGAPLPKLRRHRRIHPRLIHHNQIKVQPKDAKHKKI